MDMNQQRNNKKLFNEFPAVSTREWKKIIQNDLKGADYEKKLIWKTNEGIDVKPFYRKEDLAGLSYQSSFPGDFPYVRGNKKNNNDWYIRQDIKVKDIDKANAKALDILMKGVNSLGLILDEEQNYTHEDIDKLLKSIYAEIVEVNFVCNPAAAINIMQIFYDLVVQYNRDFQKIHGSLDYDPLGYLILKGKFFSGQDDCFESCKDLIGIACHFPFFTVLAVNGLIFNNSGSTIVEELAFSLSAGAEYLTQLTEKGISVDKIAPDIKFNFAVGPDYFFEIAKFRAARLLWAHIVKAYEPSNTEFTKMNIHAVTSDWNKTIYDTYVNMLRTTTESMSAIIAGIDSLTVIPFDNARREASDFSERIARSQQLLLKEESYLDKVVDPSAGSYYIENLTDGIAGEAWKLFLEVESKGGYIEAVKQGFIRKRIKETARKRDIALAKRKKILLGTNQYPDINEHIYEELTLSDESVENALIDIIKPYRGGQAFERLRYKTDQYARENKRPKVFLFTYGKLAKQIAGAQFSSNFFACAGFEIIENLGFKTIEDGIKACNDSNPDIVVICSSDEEYVTIAQEIFDKLKEKSIIVIAGYPKEYVDELKQIGIRHFIHIGSNVLESLRSFQRELGIE